MDKYDCIYPALPEGVKLGEYCFEFDLMDRIDKEYYSITITPCYGFQVHKQLAHSILRKNCTPLGWAISRVFMAPGRFTRQQYLRDLNSFESNSQGFLEPSDNFENGFGDDQEQTVDFEKVFDDLLPDSKFFGIFGRALKAVAENKPAERDSGWMELRDWLPESKPEENYYVTQGQDQTGKKYFRITSKPLEQILENA